ncbi:hypothetical protein EPA93_03835 [Ktedonosporobacter rubrisoli]|uniref:Uncharacterized protein n=1 Tax=Ktedonosporobacter rubrisoli TaxID=2509675 RepID=A0A4P6JJA2_KTERU|nr:hypothetical protein [Ktedonosporobacter rubrisoli]QBD75169.1 hypothetical protein EPA93_03835 [Ktedonosporobacter rubrisoli]
MINNAYGGWTPLRNALRKLDLNDTLGVIKVYSAFKAVRTPSPFPADMEVHRAVYSDERLILPWEMEILAREAIIVCNSQPSTRYTGRKWDTFASLINKLRELENYISQYLVDDKKILQEVTVRIPHQQFKYQTEHPSKAAMVRYSHIFGHLSVEPIVKAKTGLLPKQLFTIGAILWIKYVTQYLGVHYPLDDLSLPGITQADYDKFIQLYSLPMKELKQRLTAERKLDNTFMYQFHTLQSYPLILTELNNRASHICPIPTLLFWRISSGLFYDLVKEPGFDQAFGTAFQDYVGDMLEKTLIGTSSTVYPEEPDTRPKRADWIIDQPTSFMLVECKTKRMTIGARTNIQDDMELHAQLEVIGKAAVQSYQALEAYKNGKYRPQQYPYNPMKRPFICVVTLENWRLMGPELERLREIVRNKLVEAGLASTLIEQAPLILCAVNEMEEFAYLLKTKSLEDLVLDYWNDQEKSSWSFIGYLSDRFKHELESYQHVFAGEFEIIFTVK